MATLNHALERAYRFEWAGGGRAVASVVDSSVVWSSITDGMFDLLSWELGNRVAYWDSFGCSSLDTFGARVRDLEAPATKHPRRIN